MNAVEVAALVLAVAAFLTGAYALRTALRARRIIRQARTKP